MHTEELPNPSPTLHTPKSSPTSKQFTTKWLQKACNQAVGKKEGGGIQQCAREIDNVGKVHCQDNNNMHCILPSYINSDRLMNTEAMIKHTHIMNLGDLKRRLFLLALNLRNLRNLLLKQH